MAASAKQVESGLSGFLDRDGNPLANGTIDTYEAGTLVRKDVYQDRAKTTPYSNPLTLDADGKSLIFADGIYRFIIKDSLGNQVNDFDNIEYIITPTVSNAFTTIVASDVNGLTLQDDGSNNGIFIKDGGNVGIRLNTNPSTALGVADSDNTAYATTIAVSPNLSDVVMIQNTKSDASYAGILTEVGSTSKGISRLITRKPSADNTEFYIQLKDSLSSSVTTEQLKLDSDGNLTIATSITVPTTTITTATITTANITTADFGTYTITDGVLNGSWDVVNGGTQNAVTDAYFRVVNSASAGDNALISVQSGTTGTSGISLGDSANGDIASLKYDNSTELLLLKTSGTLMYMDNAGRTGFGTSTPARTLHVSGDVSMGDSGVYESIILKTGTPSGIYNGVFEIESSTIPGSGTAYFLTHFKNAVSVGTTVNNVAIDGSLGIGTTTPQTAFTVRKTHDAPTATTYNGALLIHDEPNSVLPHLNMGVAYDSGANYGWLQVNNSTNGAYNLVLQGAGGNVGIGTTTPQTLLTIKQSNPVFRIESSTNGTGTVQFYNGTNITGQLLSNYNAGNDFCKIQLRDNDDYSIQLFVNRIQMNTAGQERMIIDSNGDVGIGTVSPNAKLEISSPSSSGTEEVIRVSNSSGVETGNITRDGSQLSIRGAANLVLSADYNANSAASDSNVIFEIDGSETARINSTGNFLLGTTSSTGVAGNGAVIRSESIGTNLTHAISVQGSGGDFNTINYKADAGELFGELVAFSGGTDFRNFYYTTSGGSQTNLLLMYQSGLVDIPSNLTVGTTLAVSGATTLSSTLAVTGATTLSSTLAVTGATTLSSTLAVTGATTLSSTLAVTGATTLSSTLDTVISGTRIAVSGGAAYFVDSGSAGDNCLVSIQSGTSGTAGIYFGDSASGSVAAISLNNSNGEVTTTSGSNADIRLIPQGTGLVRISNRTQAITGTTNAEIPVRLSNGNKGYIHIEDTGAP